MKTYNIGDKVWFAQRKTVEKTALCPDCFGTRALTLIKGDGERVSLACAGCTRGYNEPTGYVHYHAQVSSVSEVTVERVEIKRDGVTYGVNGNWIVENDNVFDTREEAEVRALVLAEEYNQDEEARVYTKEKPQHTWAWNAHYHRDCIKRAEKDLLYHTAKLNVAKVRAKEPVEPKTEI